MEKDVVPPNEALVYGVAVSIVFFVVFGSLEAVHMWLFGEWNETIFSAMAFISGSLTSAFFMNGLSR